MKKIFETIIQIYSKSSRKEKADILYENKDNEKLLTLLVKAMDQYIVYGVSDKSFKNILRNEEFYMTKEQLLDIDLDTLEWHNDKYNVFINDLLPYLNREQSPSNEVTNRLKEFFKDLNIIERYFYYRVIIKNLNIGIGPKSINKVLGYILIKQYTPMLAESGMKKIDKWVFEKDEEYLVDTKINGLRLTLFINIENFTIKIRTRSGRRFYILENYLLNYFLNYDEVRNILTKINNFRKSMTNIQSIKEAKEIVIDCELQHNDKTWESSISVINLDNLNIYENNKPLFYLHCFDLTYEKPFEPKFFNIQTDTLPFRKRIKLLNTFMSSIANIQSNDIGLNDGIKLFKLTKHVIINNLSYVEKKVNEYIELGFEGGVIKNLDSKYICGRSYNWIKIKNVTTYDGVIIEILPGEISGKYNNVASKIRVKTTINGKEITGTCGSGFKEDIRKKLWENKEAFIGKVVEFTILGKTVNDNFQSGIFKCFRDDKINNGD